MEGSSNLFQGDSPVLQFIGRHGHKIYDQWDAIQMHIHLIAAALFPIYIGSHASLRRPPSAAKTKRQSEDEDEDREEDGIVKEPIIEGLTPSDAIMFPVLAAFTLGGLYMIIKWLEDPAILNKILTWYFSGLGIFGVGKLAGDSLHVVTTFIFPSVWSTSTEEFRFHLGERKQAKGPTVRHPTQTFFTWDEQRISPFPGFLSKVSFPKSLWTVRQIFTKSWIFRCHIQGFLTTKSKVQLNDVIGLLIGLAAIILYNFNGKAWWLTNLIGFGFCYGTLQLLSPTTFWTGSLVLAGLFIYDIVMVFYTPLMITVATTLEVPIKLVFPGPKRGSMLGLGDVVLPGIMMALALRFDLYVHYLRKRQISKKDASKSKEERSNAPRYVAATGVWGERFWTSSSPPNAVPTVADGARFPKVYFYASVVAYIIGLIVTLVMLRIFNHGQPALLYLVPSVLISIWGTAAARGELDLMWGYTEDGSTDCEEVHVKEIDSKILNPAKKSKQGEHAHHVFLFSLSEPMHKRPQQSRQRHEKTKLLQPGLLKDNDKAMTGT